MRARRCRPTPARFAPPRDARADILVGDDRGPRARPQRRHARSELREHIAADHDVIGAIAERDIDDDRIVRAQRRGHGVFSRRRAGIRHHAQAIEDFLDDDLVQHFARLHGDVGLGIDRIADIHQLLQRGGRIGGFQHRPVGAPLDAFHQHLEIGLEPDRDGLGADQRAGVGIHIGAAAGRQHLRAAFEQPRDHARLAGAELGLAAGLENIRDRHAGRFLDLGVGIDKGQPEPAAELAADRGLARAHHADKHDRAAAERRAPARTSCGEAGILLCNTASGMVNFEVDDILSEAAVLSAKARDKSQHADPVSISSPLSGLSAAWSTPGSSRWRPWASPSRAKSPSRSRRTGSSSSDEPRHRKADGPRGQKLRRGPDRAVPRHARGRTRRAREHAAAYTRDLGDYSAHLSATRTRHRQGRDRRHPRRISQSSSASGFAVIVGRAQIVRHPPAASLSVCGGKTQRRSGRRSRRTQARPRRCRKSFRSPTSIACSPRRAARRTRNSRRPNACATARLYCLLEVLYATGLRVSELVALPASAAKRDQRMLIVRGKGGKERLVPLNDAARRAMTDYLALAQRRGRG